MGFRLTLLTLFFLFAALQSQAQQHHKRHKSHGRSILADSVSTSDDEIKPFTPDTVTSSSESKGTLPPAIVTESPTVDSAVQADGVVKTDSTTREEPEPTPVLRTIPDSTVRAWKNSREFAYANDLSLWKEDPPEENFFDRVFNSNGFRYFLYFILGGALLFALYKIIAENNLRFFYRKPVRLKESPLTEAELPEEDLEQLLKKALEAKEYRMATRYLYLKTLRQLGARQLIRWHIRATDEEYLRQMDVHPQGDRFRWLTGVYERVWYGKFSLDEQQFSRLSQYFQDFYTTIDHSHH